MSFSELVLAIESADNNCATHVDKCFQVVEHAYDAFDVLCKEIELAIMTEAKDDKSEEKSQASEGLIIKAKNMILRLIEVLKEFIEETCDKIIAFFETKENKDKVDNIGELLEKNPKLKSIKVEIPDEKKVQNVFNKFTDKCSREITMLKAGKSASMSSAEMAEEYERDAKDAAKVLVPVTLATAYVILKRHASKSEYDGDAFKRFEKDSQKLEKDMHPEMDPQEVKEILDYQKVRVRIERERASFIGKYFKDVFGAIKKTLTGEAPINPSLKDIKKGIKHQKLEESTEIDESRLDAILDDVMKEADESMNSEDTTSDTTSENITEASLEITDELREDVAALRLEVFEAAYKGEIDEDTKKQFLDLLTIE